MKKNNAFIISLYLFIGMNTFSQSASKIVFDYDQAGNCISRKIIPLSSPQGVKQQPKDSVVIDDLLGEQKILIYPNPTKSTLKVEITGSEWKDDTSLILFNAQGMMLYSAHAQQGINQVDLSAYPKSWYILCVQINDKRKEYKIIKE